MIELRTLTADEVIPFFDALWADYRRELIVAGFSAGYADENVANNKASVYVDGQLKSGNFVFYAFDGDQKVGKLWLTNIEREGITEWAIYDIETFEGFRGKGYGRAIMVAAEDFVRGAGGDSIALNVFGNNTVARNLYESLNYETTRIAMKKKL